MNLANKSAVGTMTTLIALGALAIVLGKLGLCENHFMPPRTGPFNQCVRERITIRAQHRQTSTNDVRRV